MGFGFGVYSEKNDPIFATGYLNGNIDLAEGVYGDITLTEDRDSDNAYNGTSFVVPSNGSGSYLITATGRHTASIRCYLTISVDGVDDATKASDSIADAGTNDTLIYYVSIVDLVVGQTVKLRGMGASGTQRLNQTRLTIMRL